MIMITMTIVSLPFLSPHGLKVLLSHVSFFVRLPQPTDSDPDVYEQRPEPSSEDLGPPGSRMGYPDSSTS